MTDRRTDVATHDPHGLPGSQRRPEEPDEHPALESEAGYWADRWVEFKRLFCLFWNDGYTKPAVIGSTVVVVVTLFGMQFFGWR